MKKRIAILGSTGSIGTQTLEVISQNPDHFEVEVLTANNNLKLLIQQAKLFQEVAGVTGIVLTKLDGTAKGGVVLGIRGETQIPVKWIGIGEGTGGQNQRNND